VRIGEWGKIRYENVRIWSADQNSNCNWSLTSIIAFNYIYLFARRLLNLSSLSGCLFLSLSLSLTAVDAVDDDDAIAIADACVGQFRTDWFWLVTMSIGFALIRISFMHWDLGTSTILFHFIFFYLLLPRFIMIIMFYSTIDAQIGSCLDHLQLYTRGGQQRDTSRWQEIQ